MTLNIWHWNIAGHMIHDGRTNTGILEHAVTSIMNRDADFVSFNEICCRQELISSVGVPLVLLGALSGGRALVRRPGAEDGGGVRHRVCGRRGRHGAEHIGRRQQPLVVVIEDGPGLSPRCS
jgi:hypothetical protein